MKLIIAGSRTLSPDLGFMLYSLKEAIRLFHWGKGTTEIVSGMASGVDNEGVHLASHLNIPVKRFYPDWNNHGKAAGPIRNAQMAEYADGLLLIWDGESKGSASMKKEMLKRDKPVFEVILRVVK